MSTALLLRLVWKGADLAFVCNDIESPGLSNQTFSSTSDGKSDAPAFPATSQTSGNSEERYAGPTHIVSATVCTTSAMAHSTVVRADSEASASCASRDNKEHDIHQHR